VESSLSSIMFDDVEEHDSEDIFFCGETDTLTKDTRTAHGQTEGSDTDLKSSKILYKIPNPKKFWPRSRIQAKIPDSKILAKSGIPDNILS